MHVIESYGYRGVLGTFEWVPQKRTWIGIGLDAGVGDFPVGPVLAGLSPGGVLHAAWTVSLAFIGDAPVTLVERRRPHWRDQGDWLREHGAELLAFGPSD